MTHACARQRHAVRRLRPPRTPRPGSGTARRRFSECAARSPSERPPALPARRPRRRCQPPSPARTRAALCRWERGIAAPRMPSPPGPRLRHAATPRHAPPEPARRHSPTIFRSPRAIFPVPQARFFPPRTSFSRGLPPPFSAPERPRAGKKTIPHRKSPWNSAIFFRNTRLFVCVFKE